MTDQTFDLKEFTALIREAVKTKESNKERIVGIRKEDARTELMLLSVAIEYGIKAFDLHPLALFVSTYKPSAIAKRAIKVIFPTFDFALVGENKRACFVHDATLSKVYDKVKAQVIFDAYASGDGMDCDQIKDAFPKPDLDHAAKVGKIAKALKARMKADGLSKADLLAIVQGLD